MKTIEAPSSIGPRGHGSILVTSPTTIVATITERKQKQNELGEREWVSETNTYTVLKGDGRQVSAVLEPVRPGIQMFLPERALLECLGLLENDGLLRGSPIDNRCACRSI